MTATVNPAQGSWPVGTVPFATKYGVLNNLSTSSPRGTVFDPYTSPDALFINNEQGVWYDPSDFSTLFQDSAGTTPVTAVEQPVGLMLDKSKGLVLGPELVTNGDFSNGTTGWITWSVATLSAVSRELQVVSGDPTAVGAYQVVTTVVGKWYTVTSSIRRGTAVDVRMRAVTSTPAGTLLAESAAITSTTASPAVLTFQATSTSTAIYARVNSSAIGQTGFFDNISVREIAGNHATQATSASRPILKQDANGCYYLLFDGVDDGLATAAIDFTATDKMTVFAGVRKLSDAASQLTVELGNTLPIGGFNLHTPEIPGSPSYASYVNMGTPVNITSSASYAAPISNVVSVLFDTSVALPNELKLRVNGSQTGSQQVDAGTGNFANSPLYIGARAGTSLFFNGHLYSLIIRGAQSTDSQIAAAESYVNSKTGAY